MTTAEIDSLSLSEKVLLVERLWDDIARAGLPVTDDERVFIRARLAQIPADDAGLTWDDVQRKLRSR
jgi:putative addiction module component (TIGR02574 family)